MIRRLTMTKFQKKLWIGLLVMALLTPLGILLPEKFSAEGAWGEWGIDKIEKFLGFTPEGLKKLTDLWKAPIPDYNFGGEGASRAVQVVSYIVSGFLGIGACALIVFTISRFIARRGK
jgi:cobalt/nickel transport protein